jgi:hypothetical protein
MNIRGSRVEIQTPSILEPDQPEYGRRAVFVIAQRCSSATFSMSYNSRKEKLGALFKNVIFKLNS